jgi:hypothetical protein
VDKIMTKIYHLISEVQVGYTKKEEFRLNVVEVEAKETEQTYSWQGRRIKKSELNEMYSDHYSVTSVKLGIYTDENGLEKAKEKVVNAVRKQVEANLQTVLKLQALASQEPEFQHKVKEFID